MNQNAESTQSYQLAQLFFGWPEQNRANYFLPTEEIIFISLYIITVSNVSKNLKEIQELAKPIRPLGLIDTLKKTIGLNLLIKS